MNSDKVLVLVCKTSFNNCTRTHDSYFWGIGDIIRGIYGLYRLKDVYGYTMYVDLKQHPIGKWIQPISYIYENIIDEENTNNKVGIVRCEHVEEVLRTEFSKQNLVYFFTNMGLAAYDGPPLPEVGSYIRRVLTPAPSLQQRIEEKRSQIPFETFQILHYRLGDDELIRGTPTTNLESIYAHFLRNYQPNDVLLSDSKAFLTLIRCRHPSVFQFDHEICHVGYHDNKDAAIANTLVEFFIAGQSTKIKTFTIYGWISGFMHSVHKVFNIPLEYQTNLR